MSLLFMFFKMFQFCCVLFLLQFLKSKDRLQAFTFSLPLLAKLWIKKSSPFLVTNQLKFLHSFSVLVVCRYWVQDLFLDCLSANCLFLCQNLWTVFANPCLKYQFQYLWLWIGETRLKRLRNLEWWLHLRWTWDYLKVDWLKSTLVFIYQQ